MGFPGAQELANMFTFYTMKPNRDIQLTLQLNPKAKKFQSWLQENKAAFDNLWCEPCSLNREKTVVFI